VIVTYAAISFVLPEKKKEIMKRIGKTLRNIEHRGNDHEVASNYQMEIKIVQNSNKKRPAIHKQ